MAVNMVGRCLDQGWGVQKSPHLAAPWFRKAAERGLDWGMYNWATLLILGSGVPQDRTEALHWLRQATALHHAKSMNVLGGFYEDGWVVRKDMAEATRLYEASARGGDFRGQFNYGRVLAMEGDFRHGAALAPHGSCFGNAGISGQDEGISDRVAGSSDPRLCCRACRSGARRANAMRRKERNAC